MSHVCRQRRHAAHSTNRNSGLQGTIMSMSGVLECSVDIGGLEYTVDAGVLEWSIDIGGLEYTVDAGVLEYSVDGGVPTVKEIQNNANVVPCSDMIVLLCLSR